MTSTRTADPIKRSATLHRNRTGGVAWDQGESAADIQARRGHWWDRIDDFADGVLAGKGEFDVFYPIGWFDSPHGAQSVIRQYRDHLPEDIALTKKTYTQNGQRKSILFAMLMDLENPKLPLGGDEGETLEVGGVRWSEPKLPLDVEQGS